MNEKNKEIMLEDLVAYLYKLDGDIARYEREGMSTFYLDCLRAQTAGLIERVREIIGRSKNE